MFENVVVGVITSDDATRAVRRASEMVRASGGTLHIVATTSTRRIREESNAGENWATPGSRTRDGQSVERLLFQLRELAAEAHVSVSTHAESSEPADAFTRVALQNQADLIVVAARTKGSEREIAAIPKSVFDTSPCPVLVV